MSETPFEAFNRRIAALPTEDLPGPTPKTLFICGTPRSGTTILCQSLTYCADVGYIDNLIARFATNPALGVLLSQAMDLPKVFTGKSDFGRTDTLSEPHEFGLGWTHLLPPGGIEQPPEGTKLDPEALPQLEQLARSFAKPVVFKSFAYLWFIDEIVRALPNSCWLHVTRDISKTAKSLEKLYHLRAEDGVPPIWTSAIMSKTKDRSSDAPLDARCRAQIEDIDVHIRQSLSGLDASRTLEIPLGAYKQDAGKTTEQILSHFDLPYNPAVLKDLS